MLTQVCWPIKGDYTFVSGPDHEDSFGGTVNMMGTPNDSTDLLKKWVLGLFFAFWWVLLEHDWTHVSCSKKDRIHYLVESVDCIVKIDERPTNLHCRKVWDRFFQVMSQDMNNHQVISSPVVHPPFTAIQQCFNHASTMLHRLVVTWVSWPWPSQIGPALP